MNLHCDKRGCNHNSGFEYSCMYGISEYLIREAHSCNLMCEHLRKNILELEKLFCKDMVERIVERLEEERALLKEERKEAIEYDDEQIIFATNNQIRAFDYSLRVIREEGGMNDN